MNNQQPNSMMLRVSDLKKRYGKKIVVNGVNLELKKGEIVGLLGPNGAGKTTTFHMITGMIQPNKGRISLGEEDITDLPMYKRARKGIGYLAQEPSIFSKLTVEDNLRLVLEMTSLPKTVQKEKLEKILEDLSITAIRKSKGYNLSGGERRRVEISRALVIDPDFILLDEPFAGIDPIAVEDIQGIIHSLKKRGIGVLITDHNVRETLKIVDKVYIVNEGTIFFEGNPSDAIKDEKIKKFYLGTNFSI